MTKISNKSILLISTDNTIIESVTNAFSNCIIKIFSDNDLFKNFDLIILDNYNLDENTLNQILEYKNVINITKMKYNNIKNIENPFSINNFLNTINNYFEENLKILKFNNFQIINNTILFLDNEIILGNKEIEIIKYLYYNSYTNKDELLGEIWGYNDEIETKVLENTINKIKQKFKLIKIDDFIIFNNKKYEINELYKK